MPLPPNFSALADRAWQRARALQGFLGEREFRALLMLAAAANAVASEPGCIVEIGSFKGKSTVGLATLAGACGWPPVVSIDPHTSPSPTDPGVPSYADFLANLRAAGVEDRVEVNRATAQAVAKTWQRPIRFLWIDGDHTWAGALSDFELYAPFLVPGGIVALHDTLHFFEGPMRVFTDCILPSDHFGPAAFLHTIAWAQHRPFDGARWQRQRERLGRKARRVLPLVAPGRENRGLNRLRYRWALARIPHRIPAPEAWSRQLQWH